MPEYPEMELYRWAVERRVAGSRLADFRIGAPHLLVSLTPPSDLVGKEVAAVGRIGKQLLMSFSDDFHCAVHLGVAGRLHWTEGAKEARVSPRGNLAVWSFDRGSLRLLERSRKKRASIRIGSGADFLREIDRGGLEIPGSALADFRARLAGVTRTLKRALTEPSRFSGIGNAWSDEILHRARLSPTRRAGSLGEDESERLHEAARSVFREWRQRLIEECGDGFPTGVTAFRDGMAVHGRFGEPCPVCGSPVQRLVRAENEVDYCATCQTGGKLLRDRSLSKLLKKSWPRTLAEAEERRRRLSARQASGTRRRSGPESTPPRAPPKGASGP